MSVNLTVLQIGRMAIFGGFPSGVTVSVAHIYRIAKGARPDFHRKSRRASPDKLDQAIVKFDDPRARPVLSVAN
jgi:hypothetical protein